MISVWKHEYFCVIVTISALVIALGCNEECRCRGNDRCGKTDLLQLPAKSGAYEAYGLEDVETQSGFGVYSHLYQDASVTVSEGSEWDFVPEDERAEDDPVVDIAFVIQEYKEADHSYWPEPSMESFQTWFSVRREFRGAHSCCGCKGIAFDLKVLNGTSIPLLRVTLTDVTCEDDANKHGEDEMHWYDVGPVLAETSLVWETYRLPFEDFRLSRGYGTRQNDNELHPRCLNGVEINVISDTKTTHDGEILIRNIRSY